ncbi:Arc family DNA-binding protein [Nitratireductor pacificus]|uniref:Arc family DNA-binding protein n=1 Tax=Nitratireductor pacificus TaxID=1231180 RepID=UPI00192C80C2|nr:Arc family DNA-binding protein [Nitratireductor pacificus]
MAEKLSDATSMRLPVSLREKLERAAKQGGRSMNAEIRLRLEQSFEKATAEGTEAIADWAFGELRAELVSVKAQLATLTNRVDQLDKPDH